MAVKFPLKMSDGTQVRTIEELRQHFDFSTVLDYYSTGRLKKWLEDRYYDEEAEKVGDLDSLSEDFKKNLCNILGVDYLEDKADKLDLNNIAKKNECRERLKKYTADDKILASIDSVAFTQEELIKLLERLDLSETDEDDHKVIYLCGNHFTIPADIGGIVYAGVNNPVVKFDDETIAAGIDLQNVEFDMSDYVEDSSHNMFLKAFKNNQILALKLLQQAAEQGNAGAQFLLGLCYMKGEGVDEDKEKATKWLKKAAKQEYAEAQYMLGECYELGRGVEENKEEAVKWYRKAAKQGHAGAQYMISPSKWYFSKAWYDI